MKTGVLIFLHLVGINLFAQNIKLKNQEFSFSVGFSDYYVEKNTSNNHLDFINYVESYPDEPEFITVKLGYQFDFTPKMSADIKLIIMSDLMPDNYDISVNYKIQKYLGVGVGSMLNKNYISSFEQYQIQKHSGYYLSDTNQRQIKVYDLSFYISPYFKPVNKNGFELLFKCDLGISSFLNNEVSFLHKKKLSNEKLRYIYDTKPNFQAYIQPELELKLQTFKLNNTHIGVLLNTSYYYSKRSINYQLSTQKWTSDNFETKDIKSPKHLYSRLDFDIGFFVKW